MSFDIRHFRYVATAAQAGSFRRAAQTLRVRQSTLSRRIRQLEERLGVVLFIRHSGGIQLTPVGSELVRSAQRLLEDVDSMILMARNIERGDAGRITVGFYPSLSAGQFRAALLEYVRQFPTVEFVAVEAPRIQLFRQLKGGEIDLAIITGDAQGHDGESMALWSESIVAVFPESHRLAVAPFVNWTDLRVEQFVFSRRDPGPELRDILIAKLGSEGDMPRIIVHDVTSESILSCVAAGQGFTLQYEASVGTAQAGVVYRDICDVSGPRRAEFRAFWNKASDNAALSRFLDLLRMRQYSLSPTCGALGA